MRCQKIVFGFLFFVISSTVFSKVTVRIQYIKGEVTVRRGLEEEWKIAKQGMILKDVDTILVGENSKVILDLGDKATFTLGSYSILDIGDLRRITKREMFLYLMSLKIEKIDRTQTDEKIRIQNVSVVRAEKKNTEKKTDMKNNTMDYWTFELNGAEALIQQRYFTNSVMKLVKIYNHYGDQRNPGLIHHRLGQSFEALYEPGRAMESYKKAIQLIQQSGYQNNEYKERFQACDEAIQRIQNKMKNE